MSLYRATFLTHHNQGHFWVVAEAACCFLLRSVILLLWNACSLWKKKKELGNYCSLECHGMTKARFWLLCWVTVLVWQHPFTSSFPGVLREHPMSLQAGRCLLFKSILFNLGVVLSGILSAQILAASVTPFVSKSHIQTLNAGGNQLKKSPSFSCLPKISKKRSDWGAKPRVSKVFRILTEFKTC